MRKLKLGSALSRIGATVAAVGVGIDKIFRERWTRRSSFPFTVNEISPQDIGDDFQALWAEKIKEKQCLLADRRPDTLRWHFEIPGDRGCARVLCSRLNGELVGYTVVRSDTDERSGLRKSVIADLIARRDDKEIVRTLWVGAREIAKRDGSHVLELQGFPPGIRQVCSEWKPYQRKYPACPYYYRATDPLLHKELSDGTAWYATPFDGDATLIRSSYSNSTGVAACSVQIGDVTGGILSDVIAGTNTQVV